MHRDAAWEAEDLPNGPLKTWVPLENNPETFSAYLRKLGVSEELGIHDIYSLDDQDLLAFVPRPCYALLATIPDTAYHAAREAQPEVWDAPIYQGSGKGEPIIWFRQTIGHACGTIGALHAVGSSGAKQYINSGGTLDKLLKQAIDLEPKDRAQALFDSKELEEAHVSTSYGGQSAAPEPSDPNSNHFIAFVKADDGHLWELEGGVNGPIDRGELGADDDALSEKALDLGVRPFMAKATAGGKENINFSVVALAPALT